MLKGQTSKWATYSSPSTSSRKFKNFFYYVLGWSNSRYAINFTNVVKYLYVKYKLECVQIFLNQTININLLWIIHLWMKTIKKGLLRPHSNIIDFQLIGKKGTQACMFAKKYKFALKIKYSENNPYKIFNTATWHFNMFL